MQPAWCSMWGWSMRNVCTIPPHTTWKLRQVSVSCPWQSTSQVCSRGSALILAREHFPHPCAKSGKEFSTQLSPQWENPGWFPSAGGSLMHLVSLSGCCRHNSRRRGHCVCALEKRPRRKGFIQKPGASWG